MKSFYSVYQLYEREAPQILQSLCICIGTGNREFSAAYVQVGQTFLI